MLERKRRAITINLGRSKLYNFRTIEIEIQHVLLTSSRGFCVVHNTEQTVLAFSVSCILYQFKISGSWNIWKREARHIAVYFETIFLRIFYVFFLCVFGVSEGTNKIFQTLANSWLRPCDSSFIAKKCKLDNELLRTYCCCLFTSFEDYFQGVWSIDDILDILYIL